MGKNGTKAIIPDDIIREEAIRAIEGDLPYERTLYINEVRYLMKHTAETILEIGKRLLIIREKEGYRQFAGIVEEEIGLSRTTAYRFMHCAANAEKFPRIDLSQIGTSSKVYALLEAPEEELAKFEQLGLFAGKDMDELERMSVKELRSTVKKLREKAEKVIGKQVSKLEAKAKALEEENKKLRIQNSLNDKSATAFKDAYETANDLLDQAITMLNNANSSPMVSAVLDDEKTLKKYTNMATLFEKKFKGCLNIMKEALS
ncbi:MAG: hypothetical protein C4560_02900 [Nitrospiraceae bacterium]|nr:MAG: hypothetical protein C4560_02900 [Nitrospiraceae bacterium]